MNETKELRLCNKLWFSNPFIFSTQCCRPLIFQIMKLNRLNRLNNPSLKYQSFTPTGCRGIRKFEFVAKPQIICLRIQNVRKWVNFPSFQHIIHKSQ